MENNNREFQLETTRQLINVGHYREAVSECLSSLHEQPNDWATLSQLGLAYLQLHEFHAGLQAFKKSLLIHAQQPEALYHLGLLLDQMQQYDQAIACYQESLKFAPEKNDTYLNLSGTLIQAGRLQEAEYVLGRALKRFPQDLYMKNNFAVLNLEQDRLELAERAFDELLEQSPSTALKADILVNLARCQSFKKRAAQSIDFLQQADRLRPNHSETLFSLSQEYLKNRQTAEGWSLYRWRFRRRLERDYLPAPWDRSVDLEQPYDWVDEATPCHLLVVGEQGIGDELFFLRFVPLLIDKGYRITYLCAKKLFPILKPIERERFEIFIAEQFDNEKQFEQIRKDARAIAVGDLPLLHHRGEYPPPLPLLVVATAREQISNQLKDLPRPWIGITYSAGMTRLNGRPEKEVDRVKLARYCCERFSTDEANRRGTLVILQRERGEEPFPSIANFSNVDASNLSNDLTTLLALLDMLDHYLCVSNTNVHLMASIGKPFTLIETVPEDFRWGQTEPGEKKSAQAENPWFPMARYLHIEEV